MQRRQSLVAILGLVAFQSLAGLAVGQTSVSGQTFKYENGNDMPLPGIKIIACRQGPVRDVTSTAPNGEYDLRVHSGSPFYVVFEDSEGVYLPELQNLSGRPASMHKVDISLMTPHEAKKAGINPYRHVQRIIEILQEQGMPDDALRGMKRLLNKLG